MGQDDGGAGSGWGDSRSHPLVTDTDYDFLTTEEYFNEDDYARPTQSRNQQRNKIRDRLRNVLLDMSFLFEHLDPDEVARTFSPEEHRASTITVEDGQDTVYQGMIDTMALLFMSFYDRYGSDKASAETHVDMLVEQGLQQALNQRGMELHDYNHIAYDTKPFPVDEVTQRFLDGEALSYPEFSRMQRKSDMDVPNHSLRFSLLEAHTSGAGIDFGDGRAVEPDEVPGRSEGDRDEDTGDK